MGNNSWGTAFATTDSSPVTSVITRGVDTCTVIMITDGTNCVTAHLDAGKLSTPNLNTLLTSVCKGEYTTGQNPITLFASLLDDRSTCPKNEYTRAGFVRDLIRYYYIRAGMFNTAKNNADLPLTDDLEYNLKAGTHPNDSIFIINRGKCSDPPASQTAHPEIGFCIEDGFLTVFYTSTDRSQKDCVQKIKDIYHD